MGPWWNDLSRWLTEVSPVIFTFFLVWVLWGVLQYFSKLPDQRSRDADRYHYAEKQWTKRPTLRR